MTAVHTSASTQTHTSCTYTDTHNSQTHTICTHTHNADTDMPHLHIDDTYTIDMYTYTHDIHTL